MRNEVADEGARANSLIPHDTVSGRALTVVIAILTFLACLAAGGGVLLAEASAAWREDVSSEVTIQIKPHAGIDIDAAVEKTLSLAKASAAVAEARALSRDETERSLAPWLGSGLDLSELPIPRLVIATLATRDPAAISELRGRLEQGVPGASLDDNSIWLAHLSAIGRSLTLFAALLFALVAAAIAVAVAFATRGAMAGAREIVEVLHFVGASDGFIIRHFQGYFYRLSAEGTIAGGLAAMLLFFLGQLLASRGGGTPEGAATNVMLGVVHLPLYGYLTILAVCALLVGMSALFARVIAAAHLRVMS